MTGWAYGGRRVSSLMYQFSSCTLPDEAIIIKLVRRVVRVCTVIVACVTSEVTRFVGSGTGHCGRHRQFEGLAWLHRPKDTAA
jgi:hypothetical protein